MKIKEIREALLDIYALEGLNSEEINVDQVSKDLLVPKDEVMGQYRYMVERDMFARFKERVLILSEQMVNPVQPRVEKKKYVINYRILEDATPGGLQHKVRDFSLEGWEPLGGMNAMDTLREHVSRGNQLVRTEVRWKYTQAITRKEPTIEEMNKLRASAPNGCYFCGNEVLSKHRVDFGKGILVCQDCYEETPLKKLKALIK